MLETLIFSALAILIGLAFAFAGWTYFRILFPIWGFIVGMMGGIHFLMSATNQSGFLVTALGLVIGLAVGVLFAVLANFVYKLAVVLFGATVGYALGAGFWTLIGWDTPFLAVITGLICSIAMIGIFVSLNMPKWIMIVFTGLAGAMVAVSGLLVLFGQVPPSQLGMAFANPYVRNSTFWTIAWLVVAGMGMIAQYQTAKVEELNNALVWEDVSKELASGSAK